MLLKIIVLFGVGLLTDWLWTFWTWSIACRRPRAAGCFGAATALNGTLIAVAIFSWEEARGALGIGAYALGCGIGSWWTVRRALND